LLPREVIERLLAVVDMLEESVSCGEQLLSIEDEPTLRERLAATVLGGSADENADHAAIMLQSATHSRESLLQILKEAGVEPYEVEGECYSRGRHDVVEFRRVAPSHQGRVIEQVKPGYALDGEVIRKARVVLGRVAEGEEADTV